ncbi:MAG: prepilin peptidase [Shimia sp.]
MSTALPPTLAALWIIPLTVTWLAMCWTDLRDMRIPNAIPLAMLAVFGIAAPWVLGWATLSHILLAGLVLGAGIALNHLTAFGGGDAKVLAAGALFVAPQNAALAAAMLCAFVLIWVAGWMIVRRQPLALRSGLRIPMGPALGAVPLAYVALSL